MKIARIEHERIHVPLRRPYAIAGHDMDAVELVLVRVVPDKGPTGVGAASPAPDVTAETPDRCLAAIEAAAARLAGLDPRAIGAAIDQLAPLTGGAPAARAALDMALHDRLGRELVRPVVDLLGAARDPLPTSITIGILDLEATLAEAREYVDRGFRHLKVKIGRDVDDDVERLTRLREVVGGGVEIRVDGNQGYSADDYGRFLAATPGLALELVEQPLPAGTEAATPRPADAPPLALDESVHDDRDALRMVASNACDAFVVKLMKAGGIAAATRIARIAAAADVELMWGCMDESVISIAAALHAAYASKATRHLDLDGSFDLARDPGSGGFELEGGVLSLTGAPGLGAEWPG